MLPAFLTTLLFAVSAVSANRTTRLLGGIQANFFRITVATVFLAVWAHTLGSGLTGKAFPYFLLSGCVGFGLGDLAFYQVLPRLGSRLSVLLVHCLAAPLAAAVEWFWLDSRLTSVQISSSLTILAGVSIALAPGQHLRLPKRMLLTGIFFGTMAAVGQGLGAVLSRKAYQIATEAGQQIDGLTAAYQRILAGWLVAAFIYFLWRRRPFLTPLEPDSRPVGSAKKRVWPWVLLNALAGPTLGVGCFQWALATQPTGIVLPIIATTPIVVIPFTLWMEGERPSVRSLVGGVLAVLGAAMLTGGDRLLRNW